jgi:hypothetical protein
MSTSASFLLPAFVAPGGGTQPGLVYQPDHAGDAASRLLAQFDDAETLHAFVRLLVRPLQELEQAAFQLLDAFDLEDAAGAQLDMLGGIVGMLRDGRSDIAYRAYIRAKILANVSDGAVETILKIARTLLGESATSITYEHGRVFDNHPAHFNLHVAATALRFPWDEDSEESPDVVAIALADAVFLAVSAGVSFTLFYQYTDDAHAFTFSSVGDAEEDSTTQGFADVSEDDANGGAMIGVEERY